MTKKFFFAKKDKKAIEEHPYQRFGGVLAVIVYGGIISVSILSAITIIKLSSVIKNMILYSPYYNNSIEVIVIYCALIAASIVFAVLFIRLCLKIKNKKQNFLFFFHKLCIAYIVLSLTIDCVSYGVTEALMVAFATGMGAILLTLYFIKSVRVRTYMGSDEYLRINPFTKKVKAQEPIHEDCRPLSFGIDAKSDEDLFVSNNNETWFCEECGEENDSAFSFCVSCGTKKRNCQH